MLYEPIVSDYLGYGKRHWAGIPLILFCIMVPLSRMYLGVHSANQILFGLSLGMACLLLFKYVYQEALYSLYWEFLLKNARRKYLKIGGMAILHVFCISTPILFYLLNAQYRPMNQIDINNLNRWCGTNKTGLSVQQHILNLNSLGSIVFGLMYGFLLLSDTDGFRRYMLGLWKY